MMILKDREIKDFNEIEEILKTAQVCHVGMVDDGKPYVLPMNFGYVENTIYLHSAPDGKKIDILTKNNNVCISFDIDQKLKYRDEHVACSWGMRFRSVVLSGKVFFIEDNVEKINCLNIIMKHYTNKEFSYNLPAVKNVKIWKVEIEEITGKKF